MIDEVMRLSAVFAHMMAYSAFGLAIVIAVAGISERRSAACRGCLDSGLVLATKPVPIPSPMTLAFRDQRRS